MMRCSITSSVDGLLVEGVAGFRRDGSMVVVPMRQQRPLTVGEGPLTVTEGPRAYPVRVIRVRAGRPTGAGAYTEVYELAHAPAQ